MYLIEPRHSPLPGSEMNQEALLCLPASSGRPPRFYFPSRQAIRDRNGSLKSCHEGIGERSGSKLHHGGTHFVEAARELLAGKQRKTSEVLFSFPASKPEDLRGFIFLPGKQRKTSEVLFFLPGKQFRFP